MARNIEIKARITNIETLLPLAQAVADRGPQVILQDDTFFACAHGRLKLRAFADGHGELIAYHRSDAADPKTSDYLITPTADPSGLRDTLTRALGTAGRVIKQRTLLLAGRTRIHLDRVEGLGDFLELEVVLRDDEAEAAGTAEAHALLDRLKIDASQLLAGAYVDLLRAGAPLA
ncbi:class IV adenylate cyclase [soil metagenome]